MPAKKPRVRPRDLVRVRAPPIRQQGNERPRARAPDKRTTACAWGADSTFLGFSDARHFMRPEAVHDSNVSAFQRRIEDLPDEDSTDLPLCGAVDDRERLQALGAQRPKRGESYHMTILSPQTGEKRQSSAAHQV